MNQFNLKVTLLSIALLLNTSFVYAQTAVEYLQNGNDDFSRHNFDQAIYEYTKAIDINPNLAKAYNNRGVAYAQEGSLSRAISDFTMAIADNVNDAEAYNNRGHAYAEVGNNDQAISDYTKAIDINAIYVKAYNNRQVLYYKMGLYDKAWVDVHQVEKIGGTIDPNFIEALKKASGKD